MLVFSNIFSRWHFQRNWSPFDFYSLILFQSEILHSDKKVSKSRRILACASIYLDILVLHGKSTNFQLICLTVISQQSHDLLFLLFLLHPFNQLHAYSPIISGKCEHNKLYFASYAFTLEIEMGFNWDWRYDFGVLRFCSNVNKQRQTNERKTHFSKLYDV